MSSQTDAERLAETTNAAIAGHLPLTEIPWLLAMARRALAAEAELALYVKDCAGYSAQGERDSKLIERAGKMAAAECVNIAFNAKSTTNVIAAANKIRHLFALDGSEPTLTQHVAAECIEAIMAAMASWQDREDAAAAIRQRFGLDGVSAPPAITVPTLPPEQREAMRREWEQLQDGGNWVVVPPEIASSPGAIAVLVSRRDDGTLTITPMPPLGVPDEDDVERMQEELFRSSSVRTDT